MLLVSPIILVRPPRGRRRRAPGSLFDSTEIDEILTLRVMTMTDEEKAEARATDPRAAEIIDRCEPMSPRRWQQLHGVLRDPRAPSRPGRARSRRRARLGRRPVVGSRERQRRRPRDVDAVLVNGVRVSRGSRVRLHPSRRADAQDLFFAGQIARVTAVHADVDGDSHVGVVLEDDPAADLHEWYGRYLYFAPGRAGAARHHRSRPGHAEGGQRREADGNRRNALVCVVAAAAVVVVVRSVPDIQRYPKMRRM